MNVFVRFCMVGAVGFAVDAGLTMFFTQWLDWMPTSARIAAFLIAATVTWAFNRNFTFRSEVGVDAWFRYVFLTAIGAFINVGIYMAWLHFSGRHPSQIFFGIVLGSVAAMGFNFVVSRRFVFRMS